VGRVAACKGSDGGLALEGGRQQLRMVVLRRGRVLSCMFSSVCSVAETCIDISRACAAVAALQ
jgi:hypothetical protein